MDARKQICVQGRPVTTPVGSSMRESGLSKNDKLFELFIKIISREGPLDLSGQKIKEYTSRFSKEWQSRIFKFGGLGRLLCSDPRFSISHNVVSIVDPLKQNTATPLMQNMAPLKHDATPRGNPWKIDPPCKYKKSLSFENINSSNLKPGDKDFSPLLRNLIISKNQLRNNRHTSRSEKSNTKQIRLFGKGDHNCLQTERSEKPALAGDDIGTNSSHVMPCHTKSVSGKDGWLQHKTQDTNESLPAQLPHASDNQTQVQDTKEETVDQLPEKLYFPSAYDRTEFDSASFISEFTMSKNPLVSTLEDTIPKPSEHKTNTPKAQTNDVSKSQEPSLRWSPTEGIMVTPGNSRLSMNSTLLPINTSEIKGLPMKLSRSRGFPMHRSHATGLPMNWSPSTGLPVNMSNRKGLAIMSHRTEPPMTKSQTRGPPLHWSNTTEFGMNLAPSTRLSASSLPVGFATSWSPMTRSPTNWSTGSHKISPPIRLPVSSTEVPVQYFTTEFAPVQCLTTEFATKAHAEFATNNTHPEFVTKKTHPEFITNKAHPEFVTESWPHTTWLTKSRSPNDLTKSWPPRKDLSRSLSPSNDPTQSWPPSAGLTESYPPTGFKEYGSPSTDLTQSYPNSTSLTESWLPTTGLAESSLSTGFAESSPPKGLAESLPPKGLAESSPPTGLAKNFPPTGLAESSSTNGLAESSSPNGLAESSSPNGLVESSTNGLTESSSPNGLAESSSPNGLAESSSPNGLLEGSSPNRIAESSSPNGLVDSSSPTKHTQTLPPIGLADNSTGPFESSLQTIFCEGCTSVRAPQETSTVLSVSPSGLAVNKPLTTGPAALDSSPASGPAMRSSPASELVANTSPSPELSVYLTPISELPRNLSPTSEISNNLSLTSGLPLNSSPVNLTNLHSYLPQTYGHLLKENILNVNDFTSPESNGAHKKDTEQRLFQSSQPVNNLDQSPAYDYWSSGKVQAICAMCSLPNVISEINVILADFKDRICALNIPASSQNSVSAGYSQGRAHTQLMSLHTAIGLNNLSEPNLNHANVDYSSFNKAPGHKHQNYLPVHGKLDHQIATHFRDVEIQTDANGALYSESEFTAAEIQTDINETVHSEKKFKTVKSRNNTNTRVHFPRKLQVVDNQTDTSGTDIDEQSALQFILRNMHPIDIGEYKDLIKEHFATKNVVSNLQKQLKAAEDELDRVKSENANLQKQVESLSDLLERSGEAEHGRTTEVESNEQGKRE